MNNLLDFIKNKMRMSELYQPVIIKELLINKGVSSKQNLAAKLASYDRSIIEYYAKVLMRWPKKTLTKHGIVKYNKTKKSFELTTQKLSANELNEAILVCDQAINACLERHEQNKLNDSIKSSVRYDILKKANGKCELCGISKELSPIDIDHIIPQSTANKNGKVRKNGKLIPVHSTENLQALCFRCNRAKRNTDDTDFRKTKKLVRDNIPDRIRALGRTPKIKILRGRSLVKALEEKLVEEHAEYIADKSIDELIDIAQVILSLAEAKGMSESDFLDEIENKRKNAGAFRSGYFYEGDE
jgi:predicted house-cleaning noncanonical NTP pyrophosphatase (MazG superfamily)